ncbi:hypothetical protein G9C98_002659 [Cotesia typhae]|uniref:Vitellogenin domain-containing protein n=1 Tax=Cotesia typhae TaxID=2053667 RepID=A0A8J5QTJ5_9HYME|nr:hypothetical protein G9C98_002659 [Cotesia typhae]
MSPESNSGVLSPSKASSSWGMEGKFIVKTFNNIAQMQLTDLKTFIWNGKNVEEPNLVEVKDQAAELLKPFQIIYSNGTVTNFSVEIDSTWAINIQRSIASIFQFDLNILQKEVAFHSQEDSHYGKCNIENIVTIESDNELWVRKYFDPRTCTGHPHWTWTNVPRMRCPTGDESPIIKSSERLYKVKLDGNETEITFINATGGVYVQPFKNMYESQFLFTRQIFKLIDVTDFNGDLSNDKLRQVSLLHELPDNDLSQERYTHEKEHIFKSISILLDRLSQRLENPGLDTEINNLHNTTISILLYYLSKFDRVDLQTAYKNISGTSYKEETIRNMFLELVPQIGTKDSALFVMDLVQQKKVSDITAMQLLTQLPFHIRKPDVEFLDKMKTLIDLPEKLSAEVRNTGILTFGTLIYKTCLVHCPEEILDDYVRLYMDKFTESDSYNRKMIWLEGLANIQLGKVVEFLEPIAIGNNQESRHLRIEIKATGLTHSLSHYLESFVRIKDILKEFKLDDRSFDSPHIEIIARRINIPLTMESIQVTDLGTNVRLAATANSLFSMRGNFTYLFNGRNNHVILRTVIHGTEVVETYNPLIDVWHSAERSQSIHGYLPTNVTVGIQEKLFLSYNTPTEYLQTGLTAHARTITTVRGIKALQKLKAICQHCPSLYTVKKYPHEDLQNAVVLNSVLSELGRQLQVKVFDCDREIAQDELFNDIWSSHRSAKLLLLGIHFLDYFSYVPPRGSCGVALYIEPSNIQPSEVKLEFAKSGKNYVLSLTRSELGSLKVLQQWNFAALYESKTWVSDSLKIKASRTEPGEKVMKVCVEIERIMPWTWDYFSLKPSDQASINLNIIWGLAETAKGKCSGSSLFLNMVGEVSKDQIEESKKDKWPYNQCRRQSSGFCVITPDMIQSAHNVTRRIEKGREFLVLGQCYDENPGFALTAISSNEGVTLNINDDSNNLKIAPENGGTVYNFTDQLPLTKDFEWNFVNDKRFRLDKNSVHILLSNNIPFIHFTKDQILIFFPNYIQEFTCGVCTARRFDDLDLYEKI